MKTVPLPDFDPSRDGNPFAWIVRHAPTVRAARQSAAEQARRECHDEDRWKPAERHGREQNEQNEANR